MTYSGISDMGSLHAAENRTYSLLRATAAKIIMTPTETTGGHRICFVSYPRTAVEACQAQDAMAEYKPTAYRPSPGLVQRRSAFKRTKQPATQNTPLAIGSTCRLCDILQNTEYLLHVSRTD